MRVNTKIVIDIASGKVIYRDAYEYNGPVSLVNSSPNIPGPSRQEKALDAQQTELLKQYQSVIEEQMASNKLLEPFLYEAAGITPKYEDVAGITVGERISELEAKLGSGIKGKEKRAINSELASLRAKDPNSFFTDPSRRISGFDRVQDPLQPGREQAEKLLLDRQLAALRGDLPVNPALLRDLGEQERTLGEIMRKQVGPGWESSTPGLEALQKFNIGRNEILENARRGDLTLAQELGLSQGGYNQGLLQDFLSRSTGVVGFPLQMAQGFGGIASGFANQQALLQQNRAARTQAGIAAGQGSMGLLGDIFGGIGTLGGALIARSSRDYKEIYEEMNAKELLEAIEDLPIYRWRYLKGIGDEGEHIGPVVEEMPAHMVKGKTIDVLSTIGTLLASVKALSARVRELENG